MRCLIHILLISSICLSGSAYGQFWKKKEYHTKSTSGKVTKPDGNPYRDAFIRKSNKGPNIKTKRKPFWKSKKKMHQFQTSRKTKKPGSKKFFKAKYSKVRLKKKSDDSFNRNANRVKKKRKKGGGSSNGVFKGRKR